ncbi:MAG: Arc family DNA-binding protein [Chloroflexi bacterium]|nr:MAG: Arc family DNA-binding protein [Chloroflexota bacterium]
MPTLTIKNLPEELYEKLKRQAEINRRSLNSEVILCIERAVGSYRLEPEQYLAKARQLRAKTAQHPITDDEFNTAKSAGRQ